MGYKVEFNTILSVPGDVLDVSSLEIGKIYEVTKDGERIFPLNIPIDLSDESYHFVAKVVVRKLTLEKGKTTLFIEVQKIFSAHEANVISSNFAKEA